MYATETNYVRNLSKKQYKALLEMFHFAKNLYNKGLYESRCFFEENKRVLPYEELYRICKVNENYPLVAAKASQQVLKSVTEAMKSYQELLKLKEAGQYDKPVNPPGFLEKNGYYGITFPFQNISFGRDGMMKIPISRVFSKTHAEAETDIWIPFPKNLDPQGLREVTIYPIGYGRAIKAAFTYLVTKVPCGNDLGNVLGIDIGLDNLASCISTTGTAFIMDGRLLKSINQFYNKRIAYQNEVDASFGVVGLTNRKFLITEKRNNRVDDIIYKTAGYIMDFCLEQGIGTIVVGWGKGQKQGINLGKVTDQHFSAIPFGKLRHQLAFLCQKHGIVYVETEESYTSQSSFLDKDPLPVYGKGRKVTFRGKRVYRGLYVTGDGMKVNADLNGAANIIRKVIPGIVDDPRFEGLSKALLSYPKRIRFDSFKEKHEGKYKEKGVLHNAS